MKTNPLRFILALTIGVFISYIIGSYLQSWGPTFLSYEPLQENASQPEYSKYLESLPVPACFYLISATAIGAFFGGYVAARIAKLRAQDAALGVGLFSTIIMVFLSITFSFPILLAVGIALVQIPFSYLGGLIVIKTSVS